MPFTTKNWSLQGRVFFALVLLISSFVIVSYSILRTVIAPAFDELEQKAARSDLQRTEAALVNDVARLNAATADWAFWDDIYEYVTGNYPDFEKSNLNDSTMMNLGLDYVAILAVDSEIIWHQVSIDGRITSPRSLALLGISLQTNNALTSHNEASNLTAGYVDTDYGPMLISSRPILRSDETGPISGAVIMGQLLSDSHVAELRKRTGVDLSLIPLAQHSEEISNVIARSGGYLVARKALMDVYGDPILELRTNTLRSISALGSQTINVSTLFLVIAGMMVCALIGVMLNYTTIKPIEKLTAHIDEIRSSGDLARQLEVHRGDEIGLLGRQFNSMTADVHEARQALLDQSFKAGKADTAAEVMHNVRNAMTPMINGLERLRGLLRGPTNLRIEEAVEQLEDDDCPLDRRAKLIQYIDASFRHLKNQEAASSDELGMVIGQAKQVAAILSEQEKISNVAPLPESLVVDELLREAGNVLPDKQSNQVELEFEDCKDVLRISAHRIGLLQVMGNLILNAYESIKRSGANEGLISLSARQEVVDERSMVRVIVRDTGNGFDNENKRRIFQRGYTSKTSGNSGGLGLHWCANTVAGMGGRIFAESDGEGHGAEFHVLLPETQGE